MNRIQVDRSAQIEDQMKRQELARQAAQQAREDEVAQIRFAEDASGDFLDKAGMDAADIKYMDSFADGDVPAWKREKKERSAGAEDDSLEAMIGAADEAEGMAVDAIMEEAPEDPILMSDSDKLAADRLDAANLMTIRILLVIGFVFLGWDYLRRLNRDQDAYFPLPVPSSWADGLTPRDPVTVRSPQARGTIRDDLNFVTKRGESFVYMTDDKSAAQQVQDTAYRLPLGFSPVQILNVGEHNGTMNDEFVFETLWYGRNSFVVDSASRAERMLHSFLELLAQRKETRAHTRQTVHVVWDIQQPIPDSIRQRFANLGRVTGYRLMICKEVT